MTVAELTTEAIDAMPAGLEMDSLVAGNVVGLTIGPDYHVIDPPGETGIMHSYSHDLLAAWDLVEKLGTLGGDNFQLWWYPLRYGWTAEFCKTPIVPDGWLTRGRAKTAPLAICRAALKVKLG